MSHSLSTRDLLSIPVPFSMRSFRYISHPIPCVLPIQIVSIPGVYLLQVTDDLCQNLCLLIVTSRIVVAALDASMPQSEIAITSRRITMHMYINTCIAPCYSWGRYLEGCMRTYPRPLQQPSGFYLL